VEPRTTSRRTFLSLAAGLPAAAALAACGTAGPGSNKDNATYWYLSVQPQEGIRKDAITRFNKANPNGQITGTPFQNDAFKTKIKTAIGAGQAPTLIWGWGGGTLRSYAKAGQVDDLTSFFADNPSLKSKLLSTAFAAGTVDGKIYAMPCETLSPIVLFYNKRLFDKVGAKPPQSWSDIMALVKTFNAKGIAPFSLGGQSRWTNMMWLEFLFDRIGGPDVFQAIYNGEKDAWSNPDAIAALTKVQELVKANGFIKGFSSITADSNADQALLYTDKAAMMVHGTWTYGSMQQDGGDFVSGDHLGWMNFPPVEGGKGDPSDTVGNPAQYLSISSKATADQKKIAKKFLSSGVLTDPEVTAWINTGAVPVVSNADTKLGASKDADFLKFVFGIAKNAKSFVQSWDQALSPTTAEALLDNISKLFQLSITPQQFATAMNGTLGQ
jgi:raffinose/stachyose/melibiose transport system substrate-binding protein